MTEPIMKDTASVTNDSAEVSNESTVTQTRLDFEEVYNNYASYVAHLVMRVLGRHHEVSDVVQEIFVLISQELKTLRDPRALSSWIKVVTIRHATRRLKKRRFRALFTGSLPNDDADRVRAENTNPEERALLDKLYRVLDRLPAKERVAWQLRHIEGEKIGDIAALGGYSEATAKRLINNAQSLIDGEFDVRR